MKKITSLILAFALCVMSGMGVCENVYTPGVYEASVNGMNGPVEVKVEFSDSVIVSVAAVGEKETKGLGDVALEKLIPAVLEAQSAEVDAVAGATISSNAMLQAVASCINQAKGVAEEAVAETEAAADVIVVGAGAAGLSAAANAIANGASVIVLEANIRRATAATVS